MKLQTKLKRLFPKTNLGKTVWVGGAFIEVLGFALFFNSNKTIEVISQNSTMFSLIFISIGLFIAMSGRRIKDDGKR